MGAVADAVSNVFESTGVNDAVESVGDVASNVVEQASNVVSDIGNTVSTAVSDTVQAVEDAGANIDDAVNNTIPGGWATVGAVAATIATAGAASGALAAEAGAEAATSAVAEAGASATGQLAAEAGANAAIDAGAVGSEGVINTSIAADVGTQTAAQTGLDSLVASQNALYPAIGDNIVGLPQIGSSALAGAEKGALTNVAVDAITGRPITPQGVATGALTGAVGGGAGNVAGQLDAGTIGSGIAGGIAGGVTGAGLSGGDIEQGALKGALTGGLSGATNDLYQGLDPSLVAAGKSVQSGLTNAALTGNTNNLAENLVGGALTSAGLTSAYNALPSLSDIKAPLPDYTNDVPYSPNAASQPLAETQNPSSTVADNQDNLMTSALASLINEPIKIPDSTYAPLASANTTGTVSDVGGSNSPLVTVSNLPPYNTPTKDNVSITQSAPLQVDVGGVPITAESSNSGDVNLPQGFQLAPSSVVSSAVYDEQSGKTIDPNTGAYYDENLNAWLMPTSKAYEQSTFTPSNAIAPDNAIVVAPSATKVLGGGEGNGNVFVPGTPVTEFPLSSLDGNALAPSSNAPLSNLNQTSSNPSATVAPLSQPTVQPVSNSTPVSNPTTVDFTPINNQIGDLKTGQQNLSNQFDNLSELQKQQFTQLTNANVSTSDALKMVTGQVGDLSQKVDASNQNNQQQFDKFGNLINDNQAQNQQQFDKFGNLINANQAQNLNAINEVNTGLTNLGTTVNQNQATTDKALQGLSDAQQSQANALIAQGVSTDNAIKAVQGQIGGLSDTISTGLSSANAGNAANTKAIGDLSTTVGQNQATTDKALQGLSDAQQSQANALIAQGVSTDNAIKAVQGQIGGLSNTVSTGLQNTNTLLGNATAQEQADFAKLNSQQQQQALDMANQGTTLGNAIDAVNTNLSGQIGSLNDAQQKEVANQVAMGKSLNDAILSVQTGLSTSLDTTNKTITENQAQTNAALSNLSDAQKAQVASQVAMGVSLTAAINSVQSSLLKQSTDASNAQIQSSALSNSQAQSQPGSGNIPTPISGQTLAGAPVYNTNTQILQQLQQLDPKLLSKIAPHLANTNLTQSGLSALASSQQSSPQQSSPQQSNPYSSLMQTMLEDKGKSNPSSGLSNTLMSSGLSALNGNVPGYKKGGSIQHNEQDKHVPEFITGATGHYVKGKGDGQSDDIPAMLADGEYVFDADTVAQLGNGSSDAGAKLLDHFRESLREHKRSAPSNKIPPAASPLAYMKEALKRHSKG